MGHRQTAANAPRDTVTTISSDDECIQRLALLIEHMDRKKLNEIVALIARLTAPMQFGSH
jgi:hypothetical protein